MNGVLYLLGHPLAWTKFEFEQYVTKVWTQEQSLNKHWMRYVVPSWLKYLLNTAWTKSDMTSSLWTGFEMGMNKVGFSSQNLNRVCLDTEQDLNVNKVWIDSEHNLNRVWIFVQILCGTTLRYQYPFFTPAAMFTSGQSYTENHVVRMIHGYIDNFLVPRVSL